MITAHVSLGNMEKQWKLFTRQMIRTHQLLPSLVWKPAAPIDLLTGLAAELNTLNSIYNSYQPLIQAATQLFQNEPSFNSIPVSSKCMKRSLLPLLGVTLSWLTGTATTKNINSINQGSTSWFPCNRANKRPLFMPYHYSMLPDMPPK